VTLHPIRTAPLGGGEREKWDIMSELVGNNFTTLAFLRQSLLLEYISPFPGSV
jgi:hypothetical protein